MSLICYIQNSTHQGQFSTRPDQNALALASTWGLASEASLIDSDNGLVPSGTMSLPEFLKQCWPRSMLACGITRPQWALTKYAWGIINSLAPGRPGYYFKIAIFNLVLLIGILTSSNDNPLRWMAWDLTDDKSTLVQVMAWCRQATSHYLSQCWPSSMSPYGVSRPQMCFNSWLICPQFQCISNWSHHGMMNATQRHCSDPWC